LASVSTVLDTGAEPRILSSAPLSLVAISTELSCLHYNLGLQGSSTRNQWVSGLCPSSGIILANTGNDVSETGCVSVLR
jgi:hypothetical protein